MPVMPRGHSRKAQQCRRKAPAAIPIHPTPKVNTLHIRLKARLVLDNEDLLTEILLRLAAKSLTRFKCVCKKWLSIVSSDRFCHQHTLRWPKLHPSPVLLVNYWGHFYFNPTTNGEKKKKMIPYITPSEKLVPDCRILQVCNGLVLLQYGNFSSTYTVYDPTAERFLTHPRGCYCVYNLTTRRSRKIDVVYSEDPSASSRCLLKTGFAFDPSKSPYYKIICIRHTGSSHMMYSYQIEVYDSESHTWKVKLDTYTSLMFLSGVGTYWNNGIYWQNRDGYCCFDIDTCEMKVLGSPESAETAASRYPSLILQELNGHLYCYMVVAETESIQVWELGKKNDEDNHELEWVLKYNQVIMNMKCTEDTILRLIGRSEGGEALLISEGGKIWTYNFLDKTTDTDNNPLDIKTHPEDDRFGIGLNFHFGETLALV